MLIDIIYILPFISLWGEVILFIGIFILAVYLSFSSQRHEKLFKILVWGVVILFLNFMSCSYLMLDYGASDRRVDRVGVR